MQPAVTQDLHQVEKAVISFHVVSRLAAGKPWAVLRDRMLPPAQLTKYCQLTAIRKRNGPFPSAAIGHSLVPCRLTLRGGQVNHAPASAPGPRLKEAVMLQNIGLPGLLLIAVVVLVLFGKGKVSSLMGEVGKGITAFKKGVNDGTAEIEKERAEAAKDVTPVDAAAKDKV